MALEIEVHALLEIISAEDRGDHPRDFGTFFINGRCVEIVDFAIGIRARRVRQRAGILGKLLRFQMAHIGDALDRPRAHVGGKFLIAIDRQAFFQAELEPVAAGNAVARPVVEIFMGDDALDIGVVSIGSGFGVGQHEFVVEDVETLVLHRAHVEIGHGDDHEDIEVVFAAEALFVPCHGTLQRIHGVGRARLFAVLDINLQRHFAAGHGGEGIFHHAEIAGDKREEIAGFRMRIEPGCEVTAFTVIAAAEEIAVREQQRIAFLRRDDRHRIGRQNIRPVGEIGDTAETFRLALRAINAIGAVKPHQLRIDLRIDVIGDADLEGRFGRQIADGQAVGRRLILADGKLHLVEQQAGELQLVAIENERRLPLSAFAPVKDQTGFDLGILGVEFEGEIHPLQNEIGGAVICQVNDLARVCSHDCP
ncbi:hypothetical protein D3C71_797810 [compost metagenome]